MDQSSNPEQSTQPQTLLKWDFPSFHRYERGIGWYAGAALLTVGLFVYALVTRNFLFSIIVILIAVTMVARDFLQPVKVTFTVHEDGMTIGDREYRFREFSTFWIAYEPPDVKILYLTFKSGLRPSYPIPLQQENPLKVRTVLQKYVREDLEREAEDLTDRLGRLFKI